jgi:hypothetical protein
VKAETCVGVPLEQSQFALVDPPYTDADAAIYDTRPTNRTPVMHTLTKGLPPGAPIFWLDERTPPYRKDSSIGWQGFIGVSTSAGHRTRTLFVFRCRTKRRRHG